MRVSKQEFINLCERYQELEFVDSPESKISGGYVKVEIDPDIDFRKDFKPDDKLWIKVTYGIQSDVENKKESFDLYILAKNVGNKDLYDFTDSALWSD